MLLAAAAVGVVLFLWLTSDAAARERAPLRIALAGLLAAALFEFVRIGIFLAGPSLVGHAPAWFDEEFPPLIGLLVKGTPITTVNIRQYGVVPYLLFDPLIRIVGPGSNGMELWALILDVAAVVAAYVLTAWRFFGALSQRLLLAVVWFAFLPLVYVVWQRQVDGWQLFFLSSSLYLFTGSSAQRRWCGVPLALATLTKLLPAVVIVFLLVKHRVAGLIAVATIGVLLLVGQLLYGTSMGLGYPFTIAAASGQATAAWSMHHENNSLRGLLFKVAAGFRLSDSGSLKYAISPDAVPVISVVAYAASLAVLGYLLFAAWRSPALGSMERRSIEFCLAVMTMLLISPHTAHEFTIVTLIVFGVLGHVALTRRELWTDKLKIAALLALLLIGVFIPIDALAGVLPLRSILTLFGNPPNPAFGYGLGAYDFLGLPGLGLLLLWLVVLVLEQRTRLAVSETVPAKVANRAPSPKLTRARAKRRR